MLYPLTVVFVLAVAAFVVPIARRVLGTPVGWPRSLLVCAGMVLGFGPLLTTIGKKAHLVSQHGNRIDTLASPGITTLFVLLAGFWVFAIGLSVLVVSEVLVPTGTVPSPVAVISGWRARRRRTRRYLAVVAIATKHGLGGFIRRGARDGRGDQTRTARALRLTLDEAGVTFVKAGQLAATRGDLLPEAYIRELSLLQTQAAPAAWPDIRASIEQSLGRPLTDVFAEISSEPLAAASVAQVHAALLLDGTPVVVKVQRPAARRVVTADLDILMRLARRLDGTTAWGHRLGVLRLAEGFAESLRDELDYTVEQDNTRDVALGLPLTDPPVRIPHVHTQYSSPTLLVMDRLVGVPVSEADELLAGFSAAERAELAARLLRETLREILVSGVFHADLHPGNVFVAPDHGLGLLDFGSVGRLDEPTRHSLAVCLLAVDRNDAITATDTLLELLDHPERLDERQLEREVGQLITRFRGGLGASGSAGLVSRLLGIVHRHGLGVPPQLAAAFRALVTAEGTVRIISPDVDLVATMRSESGAIAGTLLDPQAVRRAVETQLVSLLPMLQRLPRRINRITEDLQEGRFQISLRPFADPRDRRLVVGLSQQLVLALLAATLTLGAVILLTSNSGPMLTPTVRLYAYFGYVLLFIGFMLGLRTLVRALSERGDP